MVADDSLKKLPNEATSLDSSGGSDAPDTATDFETARFPVELRLPDAAEDLWKEAANAIRQEHRQSSRWKRLCCSKVSVFAEPERGTVYVIHLDTDSVEFDWTWEGAKAFRPQSLDKSSQPSQFDYEQAAYEEEISWSGEVLEVDERHGCIFICLDNPEQFPTAGPFFVRPFEFLSVLDTLFNDEEHVDLRSDLPARLAATQGHIHPLVNRPRQIGLPHLKAWWKHAWCVLWGPPGTGKTWTTGQQIAAVLQDSSERILVVSTTNRATDAVALSIGQAVNSHCPQHLADGELVRIGKGASLQSFRESNLEALLQGTESEVLHEIDSLAGQLRQQENMDEKALTRKQIGELRAQIGDHSKRNFLDAHVRVVIATAFKATSYLADAMVKENLAKGEAPFTTIFIDEAGLMSRVAVAALSLFAARRVVLVGDSKQLSPISRMSRILPIRQQRWLASSGLSHLTDLTDIPPAVWLLAEQRRMHPQVCQLVSEYQYGGQLTTANETRLRPSPISKLLAQNGRSVWYVLDDDGHDLADVRAERGPTGSSWTRAATPKVLQKLFSDPAMRQSRGLFISPFAAQAQAVSKLLAGWKISNWEASTVHSQQGAEADIVIFDTVNAGSYTWPFDEWKRLVNVALSRAREAVIVLASRSEMDEPFLRPLLKNLAAGRLISRDNSWQWEPVDPNRTKSAIAAAQVRAAEEQYQVKRPATTMGAQIRQRKSLTPVLSAEQQRLAGTDLDGKPRLVRGVAGSGKSYVLCKWLARTAKRIQAHGQVHIWAVYANRSLHRLLRESVELAWKDLWQGSLFQTPDFPWNTVTLLHVRDVLSGILPSVDLSMDAFDFDYDRAAEEFLNRHDETDLLPRCSAMFIDEAQDMGPSTLKLLLKLVEQSEPADPNSRAAHIFYDNAQNIYDRKTPKWSEFGLDLRGRTAIMRESFRSTIPITEFALNVLYRLTDAKADSQEREEHRELIKLGLVKECQPDGEPWLQVQFTQQHGPNPLLRVFDTRQDELSMIATHVKYLVQQEEIPPAEICVIYNSRFIAKLLQTTLAPQLAEIGIELSLQTNRPFERQANTLIATTAHSYKGYESEVVIIPGVDQFVTADGQVLARNLYVAMTRARSLLAIYGIGHGAPATCQLMQVLGRCHKRMQS